MAEITNDQVRKVILETLHASYYKDPDLARMEGLNEKYLIDILQDSLGASINQIYACLFYLNEKNLLVLEKLNRDGSFRGARITALGIDVVERKNKYAEEFPFMISIQKFSGNFIGRDNYGPVSAIKGNQNVVTINHQITDAFKQAYDKVRDSQLPLQQKEAINRQLNDLEQELHKEQKADVGKISKISNWFKNNANWIVPILEDVIKKVLDLACGIPS